MYGEEEAEMKNTDIAMIILVAAVSMLASYFLGNWILGDPGNRVETLKYMDKISGQVEQPSEENFNNYALNPTVEVYVGNCGPFEVWDETRRVCVSKDEEISGGDDANKKENNTDNGSIDDGGAEIVDNGVE
jgi:hypothetical protein